MGEVLDKVLMHHGIKGMKWGVRRKTGANGLVVGTPEHHAKAASDAGRVKVSSLKTRHHSEEAKRAHEIAKKVHKTGVKSLTNDELKALTARFDLEQKYVKMAATQRKRRKSHPKSIASTLLDKAGDKVLSEIGAGLGTKAAKPILKGLKI